APAIVAGIVLLLFLWVFFVGLRLVARRGASWATRAVDAFDRTSALTKLAAVLMLLSGTIHLALIPGHEGITGILFVIDGLGFIGLGLAVFITSWWRRPALVCLTTTIASYRALLRAGRASPV